jgi:hypothetical protein
MNEILVFVGKKISNGIRDEVRLVTNVAFANFVSFCIRNK